MSSTRIWIAAGAVLVVVFALVLSLMGCSSREERRPLPPMGVVDTYTLDDRTVMGVLAQASDLVTLRHDYVVQGHLTSFKELWGMKLPFTTDDTFIALHGTLGFGIDLSDVQVEVDNRRRLIYLTLPEPYVVFNEIHDEDTISEVLRDSWLNDTTYAEYSSFIAELKQTQQDELLSSYEFRREADRRTQEVLTDFLRKADATGEYEVVYR